MTVKIWCYNCLSGQHASIARGLCVYVNPGCPEQMQGAVGDASVSPRAIEQVPPQLTVPEFGEIILRSLA